MIAYDLERDSFHAALEDRLEDHDEPDLAFAYRWAVENGKWPSRSGYVPAAVWSQGGKCHDSLQHGIYSMLPTGSDRNAMLGAPGAFQALAVALRKAGMIP